MPNGAILLNLQSGERDLDWVGKFIRIEVTSIFSFHTISWKVFFLLKDHKNFRLCYNNLNYIKAG